MAKSSFQKSVVRNSAVKRSIGTGGVANANRAISIARARGVDSFIDRVRIRRIAEIRTLFIFSSPAFQ